MGPGPITCRSLLLLSVLMCGLAGAPANAGCPGEEDFEACQDRLASQSVTLAAAKQEAAMLLDPAARLGDDGIYAS